MNKHDPSNYVVCVHVIEGAPATLVEDRRAMCQDCDEALFCMNILNPTALGPYIAHNFRELCQSCAEGELGLGVAGGNEATPTWVM